MYKYKDIQIHVTKQTTSIPNVSQSYLVKIIMYLSPLQNPQITALLSQISKPAILELQN